MDNERPPTVALARVLAGVRGADHAVGDLTAGVAREAARGPAGAKTGFVYTDCTRVFCCLTCSWLSP